MVFANRVRRQVLEMCENDWNAIVERKNRIALKSMGGNAAYQSDYNVADDDDQMFWIQVNKAECHYALGQMEEYKNAFAQAQQINHEPWMMTAFEKQFSELKLVLKKFGHLLNPPWKED
jgi:hypothetical protein